MPFQPGNPGRPKGTRNKLSENFFKALSEDFEVHGIAVLARVREEKPDIYIQTVAKLMPKEIKVERPMGEMTDSELADLVHSVREALSAAGSAGNGAKEAGGGEPARDVFSVH